MSAQSGSCALLLLEDEDEHENEEEDEILAWGNDTTCRAGAFTVGKRRDKTPWLAVNSQPGNPRYVAAGNRSD